MCVVLIHVVLYVSYLEYSIDKGCIIIYDDFFLSGPRIMQFWSPNHNLGTPSVGPQNGPLKPPPTYLGLDVLNLQILRIEDVPGMSTSSIMPFHKNVDPKLVHRLSQGQQT